MILGVSMENMFLRLWVLADNVRVVLKIVVGFDTGDDKIEYHAGTGYLIRPDLVVTVAHVLYSKDHGHAVCVHVYAKYNGRGPVLNGPSTEVRAGVGAAVPAAYEKHLQRIYDVGFVLLKEKFAGAGVNPVEYETAPTEEVNVTIAGYPSDRDLNGEKGAQMYSGSGMCKLGPVYSNRYALLEHRVATAKGMLTLPHITSPFEIAA